MKIELNEKEVRAIKVALYKHWNNMTDDNAKAQREDLQPFADCCYETYKKFEQLDNKKEFQQLD